MGASLVPDDELAALRDSLQRWRADHPALQGAVLWQGLAHELGLAGAGLPESAGGLGGGLAAHLAILQTLGETGAAEPYLSTALIGGGVLLRAGTLRASALLAELAAGRQRLAWAHAEPGQRGPDDAPACRLRPEAGAWCLHGRKRVWGLWAPPGDAPLLIVTARVGDSEHQALLLVDLAAPGLLRRELPGLDGEPAAELLFDGVVVPDEALLGLPELGRELIARTLDEATLGLCAEGLGLMQRLLHDTIAHARERRQFGAPLASFQVLQHRIADMHIAGELAQALTWAVADQLEVPAVSSAERGLAVSSAERGLAVSSAERGLAVSSAKVAVGRALRSVGQGAVQIHGAMGVTEELAAARLFRRAVQIEALFGSTGQHLRRVERLLPGGATPAG